MRVFQYANICIQMHLRGDTHFFTTIFFENNTGFFEMPVKSWLQWYQIRYAYHLFQQKYKNEYSNEMSHAWVSMTHLLTTWVRTTIRLSQHDSTENTMSQAFRLCGMSHVTHPLGHSDSHYQVRMPDLIWWVIKTHFFLTVWDYANIHNLTIK